MTEKFKAFAARVNFTQAIVSIVGTLVMMLVVFSLALGFELVTPMSKLTAHAAEDVAAHQIIDARLRILEDNYHGNTEILEALARRVCINDSVEDLQRSGMIVTCESLGIHK